MGREVLLTVVIAGGLGFSAGWAMRFLREKTTKMSQNKARWQSDAGVPGKGSLSAEALCASIKPSLCGIFRNEEEISNDPQEFSVNTAKMSEGRFSNLLVGSY